MADRHKRTRIAYEFLRSRNGGTITADELAKAADWKLSTARAYILKNLKPWLTRETRGIYRVGGMATLSLDEFILRQSQLKPGSYGEETSDQDALESALRLGETQSIEYKEAFPPQAHNLATEIAAMARTGGEIWLGISDSSVIIGLEGADDSSARSELRERIEGAARGVRPRASVQVRFIEYGGAVVCRVIVAAGTNPIYYYDHRPYIRHGSQSRPAEPDEVERCITESGQ